MSDFTNMNVLVTGANQGIGAACATVFAGHGAQVACADINLPEETMVKIKNAGGKAAAYQCDVSDEVSVIELFERIQPPATLVHCAGIIQEKPLLETSVEDFDQVINVNLRGTFLVGREAIRRMMPDKGRVILMASDMAYYGRETFSPYVASKHGVLGLARSWAKEFAPDILVNAICPGPIDTAMLDAEHMTPEWREKELAIPLARFGQPEEIAAMALFLAGPQTTYMTGQGIGVNGGSVMP